MLVTASSDRESDLLDRSRPSKHLPQYGSRNALPLFDDVIRSQLRHAF